MTIVAGVDFGTASVRVSIIDSERGRLGFGTAPYPVLRDRDDANFATQRHDDHCTALEAAFQAALSNARIKGQLIEALAIDTTGSTVVPVDEQLKPLDDYYLWCDHRAWREAAEITAKARERKARGAGLVRRHLFVGMGLRQASALAAAQSANARPVSHRPGTLRPDGGDALRHQESVRAAPLRLRHGPQMDVERGAGRTAVRRISVLGRSLARLACGSVWMAVIGPPMPLPAACRTNGRAAWACEPGIPIPVGALDAHWDAIGAGCRLGDVVNVIGTSTCIMALSDEARLIPGRVGNRPGLDSSRQARHRGGPVGGGQPVRRHRASRQ